MKKTIKKSLAVLAAASVCSSMLLNFPSGAFSIHWNWRASAEETEEGVEGIAIDATNFPDERFRTYIQENFDTTADGILTEGELEQVTSINVSSKGISDLTGVEYFTVLKELSCFDNNLSKLDVRQNSALQRLQCHYNNLTELDVSQNSELQTLYCSNNNLTKLDLSQNTVLQQLYCFNNNLTELDVRQNPSLEWLYCNNNNLTELDVRQNPALQLLNCSYNNLTELDVRQNPDLKMLYCSNNTYSIALTGGTFDLSTLPGNFDVSKASNWTNATVDGNTLTVTGLKTDVTYTYDLGNGKTVTFTLHPASCTLTESMVEAIPLQGYSGSAVTPDVTLKYGDDILQKDTNYTISYASNIEIGTAKVTITGMGFFTGEITVPFEIGVAIDAANFPDETFRTYVKENIDTTPDDILTVSELEQVTMIDVSLKEISDLTGVEYFTALKELYCGGNNLTELDVRQNTALQQLHCFDNNLTELDLSQNTALQTLSCNDNNLTELDLSQNSALQRLQCHYNNLTELDVSQNTALQELFCSNNNLTKLDLSQNTALQELHCFDNNLTKLDLSQNTALQTVYCYHNNLTELDVHQNPALQMLFCYNNNLTALDLSQNPALTNLACSNNTYSIALTGGTFDLSTLPGNFDVSKASNWTNATVDGNTLTVTGLKTDVTYTYDLGNGKTVTFTLHPASCTLTESMVEAIPLQGYSGSAVTPDVTLKYGDDILQKDTDYTVSYAGNEQVGTAKAILTGIGSFAGEITVPFEIGVAIDAANFPDEKFRTYVKEKFDTTPDDILTVSELEQVIEIDVSSKKISDLTGVEYFTALQRLYCFDNNLTKLDLSQNTALKELDCSNNNLTELDLSRNTALKELICSTNLLKELDVSQNIALDFLNCSGNNLTELDVHQNTTLQILSCGNNLLRDLDVHWNTALQELYCYDNNLAELDVSQNTALQILYCDENNLTALDLSQNPALTDLDCSNNIYSIALTGGTFDLSTLPGNFDVSKASNWTNATVDGNTLTVTDPKTDVTYTYDLGNGKTETFTLHPTSCTLTESMVETIPVQSHTGSEVTPDVTLKCGDTILQKNTNYTISYASNIEIGTAKVTITGMGFFTGEITVPFEIGVAIDAKNFPDENFRTYVQENIDRTADGILSKNEREQVTMIDVLYKEISDLTGVEYFTALQWLNCYGNQLKKLDVRQNAALQILSCYSNNLTELDLSQNPALQALYCDGNNLTELDLSQNTALQILSCSNNNLTELDLSQNTALQELSCSNNNLTELDLSQNTALQELYCSDNNLTELDLSQNIVLEELNCSDNNFIELDVRQNTALQTLNCYSNNLTELNISQNTALQRLYCHSNNLTKLDVRQNTALQELSCYYNNLTELDVRQNTALRSLWCNNNNLIALDLSQNPALTSLGCYRNTYSIALTDGTFDLNTLPETFDASKASNWKNATVDGSILTVTDWNADVIYTYDLGNGETTTFTLHPASCILIEDMVEAIPDQIYTGSELTPEVTWKYDIKDADYTISYKDNIDAGTATVTITGKKFWEGSITIPFTILPADLTTAEIKLKEKELVYNEKEQSPSIGSITVGDMVLTEDDYSITGNTATESGTYTMTVQGKGNFTGKATAEWSIVKATPSVTPVLPDQKYTEGDSLPKLGYKCSVDGVITWITNLEKGLIEGENELKWIFIPDDADNYEIVTGTALIVAETTITTTTTTTTTTINTTTTTAKPVTSTTTKTNATTTSTTKAIATTTATKPVTTSTTKAIATTITTKPVTTSTTKTIATTITTKPVTTSTTKAATTTTATKPVTTSTTKAATTTTATKPVTTSTTKAVVTTTATKPITTNTTKAVATTITTKPVTTSTTKAIVTTTATKPITTSTTKAIATTTATKPITTSTTKAIVTTTATKPVTTSTTKAMITTTATKPITTSTTKAIATTTATKPITTTTKPVTTIQTTTSTNETTTKVTLITTTAQTTTRTNVTTTTTQATTTSTTTNATTTTMQSTITSSTVTTTTTTLLTTTSSVVSTTTTPVVTTVPTTTTGETSIVVVPKEADFYFAEDTTTFTPSDLFESITLIQEDGTEVDITDQITLSEVSPSTVETDEQHRAILPVFYQDELLAELTVPVYIGKKGDIDLDGDVTLADATLALTYYSEHAVNNDFYFTTQSAQAPQTEAEQMLEKLMFFLADIDTESKQGADTDNGMIELLDATRILTYYAEQAVGNLPSWSN